MMIYFDFSKWCVFTWIKVWYLYY